MRKHCNSFSKQTMRRAKPRARSGLTAPLIVALGVLLAGCTLPSRRISRTELLQSDLASLEREMEGLRSRLTALEESVAEGQANQARAAERLEGDFSGQLRVLEQRIAQLEKLLAEEVKQRARDREEIVNSLSRSMEKAIRKYCGAGRVTSRTLSGEGYEHVVQAGETLSEIAKAYGVTVRAIVEANDIADPDRLQVGQKLFIPH